MDFNKLPGSLPGLDNTFGKLFPNADGQYTKEEFSKMQECAEMLEKYVSRFPKENNVRFSAPDMENWKNDYFKTLVHGGPKLLDDQFYTGDNNKESNLGIGTDGEFTCEELFQFLFRLYKAMATYKVLSVGTDVIMQNPLLFSCAEMLENYVNYFPKTKGCVDFSQKDKASWIEGFFPNLVEGGPKLLDYAFFKPTDKNYGIGADGQFHARELFHFLYRLYKEIVNSIG